MPFVTVQIRGKVRRVSNRRSSSPTPDLRNFAVVRRVGFVFSFPPRQSMLLPTPSPVPPPECPLAVCIDYISGAWTPHILWYLRAGPRRFGDLRRDLSA